MIILEIKVNDYVRTKDGLIGKIIDINLEKFQTRYELNNSDEFHYEGRKDIIKSSPNIIDLIKIGDYVNGYIVSYVGSDSIEVFWYKDEKQWLDKEDIKSIVTKEMFEQMEYKIN